MLRLAGAVAAGVAAAVAGVSALTLARAGALPDPGVLFEWAHIFTNLGWFSLALPTASLHLVVYATFAAAIVVAAVRVARAADDTLLTGLLAWSGVFGLLIGSYYVGRPDDLKLVSMLSAAAFALVLLTIACGRALAARDWRAPTLAELLVLFGFALAACTLVDARLPHHELARLTGPQPELGWRPSAEPLLEAKTQPGQTVAILLPESYRLAYDVGLRNVAPYGISNAIVTVSQMRVLLDTIRRERVTAIFVPEIPGKIVGEGEIAPQQFQALLNAGFVLGGSTPGVVYMAKRP